MSYDPIGCGNCGCSFDPSLAQHVTYPGHGTKILCPDCRMEDPYAGMNREERRKRTPERCKRKLIRNPKPQGPLRRAKR